jgi:bacterioferritin
MKGCDMMENHTVIEELNTLLRGTYMGIRSMEHYIEKVDDVELKRHFQSLQQETKQNAQKLAERIQNLNGVPADSEGITGAMQGYMHRAMLSENPKDILEDALKGIDDYGVHYSEEVVKGDLDPESKQIVEEVIDTNRRHADFLRQLLH